LSANKNGRKHSKYKQNKKPTKQNALEELQRSYIAILRGDFTTAEDILNDLDENFPERNNYNFNQEEAFNFFIKNGYYNGDIDDAEKIYKKVTELHLKFKKILNRKNENMLDFLTLGKVYKNQHGYYNIMDSVTLQALGVHLCYINCYEDAKFFLMQSIIIERKNHHSYQWLGDCFRFQNKFDIALLHYKKAISIKEAQYDLPGIDVDNYDSDIGEYYYCLGMAYTGLNNYTKAIEYFIKAKTLKDNAFFGYIHEGFSGWDDIIEKIRSIQNDFEKKINPTQNDYDDAIEKIETITGIIDYGKSANYIAEIISNLTFFSLLNENSRSFLKSAETLYHSYPEDLDYSPVMLQYCKIIESELLNKFVNRLKKWAKSNNQQIQTGPDISKDINKFERIFLGNYIHILKNDIVKRFIDEQYPELKDYLKNKLPAIIKEIATYRNSSAHTNQSTKQKVTHVRNIILERGLLENIAKL
jgi:tetratricopeptide (TPR) repeat protein